MRKKLRKPLTAYALKLAIQNLEKLRAGGNDPKAVLEQSVLNGYQGLFEIRVPFTDREAMARAQRHADATVGKFDPNRPVKEPTPEEKAEYERERIDLERWNRLENGTLEVSNETVAWVKEKAARFARAKLPLADPRPRWFKAFLDRAMPGQHPAQNPARVTA